MRAEEELIDCIVRVAVDPSVVTELVPETLVSLEALVATAIGTTITTCGVAVVVLSSCVVAVYEVVDAAVAVFCEVWVVVTPSMLSARAFDWR